MPIVDQPLYRERELHLEDLSLSELGSVVGTPVYVYSQAALLSRASAFVESAPERSLVCYAVKANSNPHLLRMLVEAGLGADVTSGGELFLAQHVGFDPKKILFSGVGKTELEMEQALDVGVRALHVESEQELHLLARVAAERGKIAKVAVRVNPGVVANTHAHISTGERQHKFGVPPELALAMLQEAKGDPWLCPVGLATHIGSQVTELAPFEQAAEKLVELAQRSARIGIELEYLDFGGGLGVSYVSEKAPDPPTWIAALVKASDKNDLQIVIEPGRSLVAPAGLLLTRVLYLKDQQGKRFAIVDAGMSALLRPALYDAQHPILPVKEPAGGPTQVVDIVGPVCESGDFLARERRLPPLEQGDLLAVLQVGAYGFAMSSNYNGQLRPSEVLVSGAEWRTIRERENFETLLRGT